MSKTEEVKISKIEVKLGDTKISLTPEQAKKLHAALHEMFGDDAVVTKEYIYSRPWWSPGYVYCASGTSATYTTANAISHTGTTLSINAGAH